ncbi:hypothetical protein GGR51DRAFT_552758 [Nemania sp. FL0031]|nr:hypothetical protein GGR51DRAFT_552758 [Nemania sp. FL0031]
MGTPSSEPSHVEPSDGGQHDFKEAVDLTFRNWGRTTIDDIQTIVRNAIQSGKGVQVSGFRHSWSPVFGRNDIPSQGNNGDVLILTLPEEIASTLPCLLALPGDAFQPKKTELNGVKVVDSEEIGGSPLPDGKKYISVGMATTNEQFRRWRIKEGNVTLPVNVIMVEITYSGSNAPICHGAGIKYLSLSDLVRCIEYVDAYGELRAITMGDPALKAASGCFGLLGVVTRITFECDAMSTAVMRPAKLHVIEAIPPPPEMKDSDIPADLRKSRTPEQKKDDLEKFKDRANNEYYAEWFWFPFSDEVWVNTWSTEADPAGAEDYPSIAKVFLQVIEAVCMDLLQEILSCIDALQLEPELQTKILCELNPFLRCSRLGSVGIAWFAMMNLDERKKDEEPIRALLPDALHFQRGIQNLRVRDLEVAFPGNPEEPDYTNVQRAWWDAIKACYEHTDTCPLRMPLEMRIIGPSEVTMAPQRGNSLGTCAIEILTLKVVADIWQPFAQEVLDKWMSYKDNDGKQLVVKPHWAKEWINFSVDNMPWVEKLKSEVYKDEIIEFKTLLADIGKRHNWTLADVKKTFSNELLDYLYLDDV